tara:strand:+ start:568 stop:969 length:402 start_codon:yes stop_codon:yes gene_type:complete
MNVILDNYFALDSSTLQAKNKRLELISENIANTSTPGFKARDLDFGSFIENAQNLQSRRYTTTHPNHIELGDADLTYEKSITFHQPLTNSIDGNTVEIGVEQAKFGKAVADYEAAMGFLENRISGIRKALRGE